MIRKVFAVKNGKTTTKIPGLDPGTYEAKLKFKQDQDSSESYCINTRNIFINPRTPTLTIIPSDGTENTINTSGSKGLNFKIECNSENIDSNAVNGVLKVQIKGIDNNLIDFAEIDIEDYTNKEVTQYTISESTVQLQWDSIVESTGRANRYGKYDCILKFIGKNGFSDITQDNITLNHKTSASVSCLESKYYVDPKYENGYTQNIKAKIVDENNNAIKGITGNWYIRLKDSVNSWETLGEVVTSDENGIFSMDYDVGTMLNEGSLAEGSIYEIQFRVNNPYMSDEIITANSLLHILNDSSNFKIYLNGVECSEETPVELPYGANVGGTLEIKRQNGTNSHIDGTMDCNIYMNLGESLKIGTVTVEDGSVSNINSFLTHEDQIIPPSIPGESTPTPEPPCIAIGDYFIDFSMMINNIESQYFRKTIAFKITKRNVEIEPLFLPNETEFKLDNSNPSKYPKIEFKFKCTDEYVSTEQVNGQYNIKFAFGTDGYIDEGEISDFSNNTLTTLSYTDSDIDFSKVYSSNVVPYVPFTMRIMFSDKNGVFNNVYTSYVVKRYTTVKVTFSHQDRTFDHYDDHLTAKITDANNNPIPNVIGSFKITSDQTKPYNVWRTLCDNLSTGTDGIVKYTGGFASKINSGDLEIDYVYVYRFILKTTSDAYNYFTVIGYPNKTIVLEPPVSIDFGKYGTRNPGSRVYTYNMTKYAEDNDEYRLRFDINCNVEPVRNNYHLEIDLSNFTSLDDINKQITRYNNDGQNGYTLNYDDPIHDVCNSTGDYINKTITIKFKLYDKLYKYQVKLI